MADILKKVLQLAKEAKLFITYNESGSVQWLGDGLAFYQLCEQENLTPQFLTAAAKLTETDVGVTAFQTIDLKKEFFIADNDETEAPCDSGDFNIVLSGKEYKIFNSPQFGARMIPKKYLDMFADGYSVYIRECSHGEFFAIKEGMLLRAVIANDWQILLNTIYAQDIKNFADNVQKAVDLAKESEQVSMEGEKMGDLIDRESLLKDFQTDTTFKGDVLLEAEYLITHAEPVEAKEVVRARWIEEGNNFGAKVLRCTNCKKTVLKNYSPKFCEYCGAEMVGV